MPIRLSIVVVGAGLSGLSASIQCALAGHNVTVLESMKQLTEIGAGLQLTPNATRLLQQWGVYELIKGPCEPKTCTVHNYQGKVLAHKDNFNQDCVGKYRAPLAGCHRADLQQALIQKAMELGVLIKLNARVIALDLDPKAGDGNPRMKSVRVTMESRGYLDADLVVAADGLWSTCRSIFLGRWDAPLPTGDLTYRIVLPIEQIEDNVLRDMVVEPGVRLWSGSDAYVVAYSMRGGSMYNVALLVSNELVDSVAKPGGNAAELRALLDGWDPVLIRLLDCAEKVDKWKVMHREPLTNWMNPQANLVFVGDACHPMLPYLAQGASSSIEDGAVLGLLLHPSRFFSKLHLWQTLQLFQELRQARGEAITKETIRQRKELHLRDRIMQRYWDDMFGKRLGKEEEVQSDPHEFPSPWTCPDMQAWLYGYDAVKEVEGLPR